MYTLHVIKIEQKYLTKLWVDNTKDSLEGNSVYVLHFARKSNKCGDATKSHSQ